MAAAAFSGNDRVFKNLLNTYKRGVLGWNNGGGDPGVDDVTGREFPKAEIVTQIKAVLPNMKDLLTRSAKAKETAASNATRGKGTPESEATIPAEFLLSGCYGSRALKSAVDHVAGQEESDDSNKSEESLSTVVKEAELDDPITKAKDAAKGGVFDDIK